jgi:hypothetical protein
VENPGVGFLAFFIVHTGVIGVNQDRALKNEPPLPPQEKAGRAPCQVSASFSSVSLGVLGQGQESKIYPEVWRREMEQACRGLPGVSREITA